MCAVACCDLLALFPVDKELASSIASVPSLLLSCNISGLFSNWIALFLSSVWGVLYTVCALVLCQICPLQVFLLLCNLSCHLLRKPFSKADGFSSDEHCHFCGLWITLLMASVRTLPSYSKSWSIFHILSPTLTTKIHLEILSFF